MGKLLQKKKEKEEQIQLLTLAQNDSCKLVFFIAPLYIHF